MKLSRIAALAKTEWIVNQLFCLKRCFGPQATIGIVESGNNATRYGTVAELHAAGHASDRLLRLDRYLSCVPRIYDVTEDGDYEVIEPTFMDDGPPSPWDEAQRERNAARARANKRRAERRALHETDRH